MPPADLFESLASATKENKKLAIDAVERCAPRGTEDPESAIVKALQWNPEVVWLLHDGNFDHGDELLAAIKKARCSGTRINTSLVYDKDDDMPDDEKHFLWKLARDNGGVCVGIDGKPISEPSGTRPAAIDPVRSGPSIFREPDQQP